MLDDTAETNLVTNTNIKYLNTPHLWVEPGIKTANENERSISVRFLKYVQYRICTSIRGQLIFDLDEKPRENKKGDGTSELKVGLTLIALTR